MAMAMAADHPKFRGLAAMLLSAALAACSAQPGLSPDDRTARFLVAPDRYALYSCPQLAERAVVITTRENELQALIVKAGTGAGGRFVSATAYRPEYLELRGEMNELQRTAGEKKCKIPAVTGALPERASDNALR
ncbi:MAG: hypothetical protein ABI830_08445 [Pseudolabrys sp.]